MSSLADATAMGAAPPAPTVDDPRVSAVRPDGTAVSLPQSSVPRALELGYKLENAADTTLRKRHAEYATVGHELASAGLGAARGVTFGLSDLALRGSGLVSPETLRAYSEENPSASALGEAGGILGVPLFAAADGAIGAAAGAAGVGIAATQAVGEAAAGLASKAAAKLGLAGIDSLALDALGGVAQGAVRGATEGAVYGLGQGVSNLAMRDEKDLGSPGAVAQVLVAHAGLGAALGGAISGAVGGVSSLGIGATKRVLRALGTSAEDATLAGAKVTPTAKGAPIDVPDDLLANKGAGDGAAPLSAAKKQAPAQVVPPDKAEQTPGYTIAASDAKLDHNIGSSLAFGHEVFEPTNSYDAVRIDANDALRSVAKHGGELGTYTQEHVAIYDHLAARTKLDGPATMVVDSSELQHVIVPLLKQDVAAGQTFAVPFYLQGQIGNTAELSAFEKPSKGNFLMHVELPEGQHAVIQPAYTNLSMQRPMSLALPREQQLEILEVRRGGPDGMFVRARATGRAPTIETDQENLDQFSEKLKYDASDDAAAKSGYTGDLVDASEPQNVSINGGEVQVAGLSAEHVSTIVQHQHGRIDMHDPAWYLSQEMRKGKPEPRVEKWAREMDTVMARAKVSQPFTVYRGIQAAEWAPDLQVGSTVGDRQFQSFSSSERVASSFAGIAADFDGVKTTPIVFELRLRPGEHALPVTAMSPGHFGAENEVLLPRDLTYRVTSIREARGGVRHMNVELVPKQAAGTADAVISLADNLGQAVDHPHQQAASGGAASRLRDMALRVAGGTVANVASITSGVDDSFLREMLQPGAKAARMREIAVDGEEAITQHTRNIDKVLTHIEDNSHAVMTGTLGELKAARIEQLTKKGVAGAQLQAARDVVMQATEFLREYQGKQYAQGYKAGLRRLKVATEALTHKLDGLEGDASAGGRVFIAMDQYKRLVGQLARPGAALSAAEAPVVRAIRDDLYNGALQPFLEDTALWGDAGTAQAKINRLWVNLLDKKRQFNSAFLTEHGRDPNTEFWQTRQVADPAKVYEFLRNVTHVKNDLKRSILSDQLTAAGRFAKAAKEIYAFQGKTATAADEIVASAETAQKTIASAVEDARVRNLGKQLSGTSTGRVLGILSKLDQAAGIGPEVRAELRAELRRAAARMGSTSDPRAAEAQQVLEQLDKMHAEQVKQTELGNIGRVLRTTIRTVGHLVDKSVQLSERTERVAIPVAISQAKGYALSLPGDDADDENDRGSAAQMRRWLRQVHRYSAQPEALAGRVDDSLRGLAAVAPHTAAEVATAAGAAVAHLEGMSPRPRDYGLSPGLRADWQPTTTEAAAFTSALRAIMHPMSVPEDMAAGTLTRPGVEALGAVYPGLHDMIATMLAVRLQGAKTIPLQRRLQLSALWNLQTDAMVDPTFASMVQGGYAPPQQPRAPSAASYNSTDRTALRREVATPTQRIGA